MNPKSEKPKGWYNRGYLPHFDGGEIPQFITYRLFDSLPQDILARWKSVLEKENLIDLDLEILRLVEKYLDAGHGCCYLKDLRIANIVEENLLYFDNVRYHLLSWVIMPNHIHLLLTPSFGHSLSFIMKNMKSFTSHEANKVLNRKGKFWIDDYFDRFMRDAEHFDKTVSYIEKNPVKAGLCEKPEDWRFSSAWWRKKAREPANDSNVINKVWS